MGALWGGWGAGCWRNVVGTVSSVSGPWWGSGLVVGTFLVGLVVGGALVGCVSWWGNIEVRLE